MLTSLKGVNFVARDSVVLCDQMTFGSSSTHLPFGRFDGSVELRVVHRREAQLGSQLRIELSEGGAIELLVVVNSDLLREAEAAYNILPEELLQGCSCDVSKHLGFDSF